MIDILENKNREQAAAALKELYEQGYRYVTREEDSEFLVCFTLKPKKYREIGWGYADPEDPRVKMAYPFKNMDITEINWSDRSATWISDFLEKEEGNDLSIQDYLVNYYDHQFHGNNCRLG
ncbi:hypothetical protein QWY16_11645 [Planococcus shenhongbingii]|uniref:hypothetical protein n=1 Tax=Planococcus shenhongbingii TaxID=3058398 RepID=UPI00260DCB6C|nr:hypothetical protein [Planococcus sp. N016]WKA57154.1 hypothetical protein QWY16_11645 [Planococcus sp. N016]